MTRISEFITGLWRKHVKVNGVSKQKFEVRLTEETVRRLQSLKTDDILQVWENEQRKGHNSPTHLLRSVPGGNFRRKPGPDE